MKFHELANNKLTIIGVLNKENKRKKQHTTTFTISTFIIQKHVRQPLPLL